MVSDVIEQLVERNNGAREDVTAIEGLICVEDDRLIGS
jgi:hypothetical protein